MVNVAVCDDNKAFLDVLCRMTDGKLRECGVAHIISDYLSGKVFLEHHRKEPFDVVFLDIVMPDTDGFEVAKEIRKISEKTYIIFVTTESNLVYDSLDFRPFNFIPKDSPELLEAKFSRVVNMLARHLSACKPICLEMAFGERRFVEPSSIIYVQSKANYLDYILSTGDTLHIRGKIDDALSVLSPQLFNRIHNRNIINMSHIKRVDYPNGEVIMDNGHEISISRTYKRDFDDAYTKYLRDFN